MAIDTTVYSADIPAGTYAVGDVVNLVNTDGPGNVRSGRGAAKLKNIVTAALGTGLPNWKIHVKNSDWIDDVESFAGQAYTITAFDEESSCVQSGHDCDLTPNSGWQVWAECILAGTSTTPNSIFALIDVDYPSVGGVTIPKKAVGFPTSIVYEKTLTVNAVGTATSAQWDVENVDYFKAGYKYVLDAVELLATGTNICGFMAFSNAAGMGGLTRIIPVNVTAIATIRYAIRYSSVLVKGPMDVKFKLFAATAGTAAVATIHDYVKQKA